MTSYCQTHHPQFHSSLLECIYVFLASETTINTLHTVRVRLKYHQQHYVVVHRLSDRYTQSNKLWKKAAIRSCAFCI